MLVKTNKTLKQNKPNPNQYKEQFERNIQYYVQNDSGNKKWDKNNIDRSQAPLWGSHSKVLIKGAYRATERDSERENFFEFKKT